MATVVRILLILQFIFFSCGCNLAHAKENEDVKAIVASIKSADHVSLLKYFSNKVMFAFVMPLTFFQRDKNLKDFVKKKDTMYSLLFNTNYVKKYVNKRLVSFRDAFVRKKYYVKKEKFYGKMYITILTIHDHYNYQINLYCTKLSTCKVNSFSISKLK